MLTLASFPKLSGRMAIWLPCKTSSSNFPSSTMESGRNVMLLLSNHKLARLHSCPNSWGRDVSLFRLKYNSSKLVSLTITWGNCSKVFEERLSIFSFCSFPNDCGRLVRKLLSSIRLSKFCSSLNVSGKNERWVLLSHKILIVWSIMMLPGRPSSLFPEQSSSSRSERASISEGKRCNLLWSTSSVLSFLSCEKDRGKSHSSLKLMSSSSRLCKVPIWDGRYWILLWLKHNFLSPLRRSISSEKWFKQLWLISNSTSWLSWNTAVGTVANLFLRRMRMRSLVRVEPSPSGSSWMELLPRLRTSISFMSSGNVIFWQFLVLRVSCLRLLFIFLERKAASLHNLAVFRLFSSAIVSTPCSSLFSSLRQHSASFTCFNVSGSPHSDPDETNIQTMPISSSSENMQLPSIAFKKTGLGCVLSRILFICAIDRRIKTNARASKVTSAQCAILATPPARPLMPHQRERNIQWVRMKEGQWWLL